MQYDNEDKSALCFSFGLIAVLLIILLLLFLLEKHKSLVYWQEKADKQAETLEQLDNEIADLNIQISELERTISFYESWQNIGEFKITYYWPGEDSYGTSTSTGAVATEGRTVAVDPEIIPYGTEIMIDGHIYVAEDTGSALKGNRTIDIFVNDPKEEMYYTSVYIRR